MIVILNLKNSSETTSNAAKTIAESLGVRFHRLDVDAIVKSYISMIEGAEGRALTWDDLGHYQKIVKILIETDRIMREIELPLELETD